MVTFFIKNRMLFIVLGGFIALLFLVHMMSPAFASTLVDHEAKTTTDTIGTVPGPPQQLNQQQNNQSFHGITNTGNRSHLLGANQGNSGNPGFNRGWNQDSSLNGGNAISSQRKSIGVQVNNQSLHSEGNSQSGNEATLIGHNQGNSGNEGINLGNNQDNANNAGNQVNNQGNIIGTQINNQGTTVNNQGNTIEHQINYVSLLPGIGVSLSLHPKFQFGLNIGEQNASQQPAPETLTTPPLTVETQKSLAQPAQQHPQVTTAGSQSHR